MLSAEERSQVFARAAKVVERGWTQGWYARDEEGGQVDPNSPAACSWCMFGAYLRAVAELDLSERWSIGDEGKLGELIKREVGVGVGAYNDAPGRRAEDVAAVLRKLSKEGQ